MRLYDNSLASHYEEFKSWYPVWYWGVHEMDVLWRLMGKKFDELRVALLQAVDNCFLTTADSETLADIEQFLFIKYDGPRTLEERRLFLISLFAGRGHIGEKEIRETVAMFTAGEITIALVGGRLEITALRELSERSNLADCVYLLQNRLPAHLRLIFNDSLLPIQFKTLNSFRLNRFRAFWKDMWKLDGSHKLDGSRKFGFVTEIFEGGLLMTETGVITAFRRQALCQVTSGALSSISPITHVAFGNGGVDGGGIPIPPSETQTALNNELARYPIDGVTYPSATTARYTATIPIGALPGEQISEAALIDAAGNLCAIKTMLPKLKEVDTSFVFEFDDEFGG